jgi:hypothetical protein
LLQAASVLETLAQERDQLFGDVHATAASVLGEGENPGGVFVAAGAGGAVFADAGFFDQGQGALQRRPEGRELSQELPFRERERVRVAFHVVCIIPTYNINNESEKKWISIFVAKFGKSPPSPRSCEKIGKNPKP